MSRAAGGKLVAEGHHPVFIGHGQIKAAGIHGLQTVHGGGKGLFVYVKGQVAVVQVQGLEGRIVHHGGNTVGTGAAKEADEARMPGDGMFHISLQIDLMKLLYQRREKIATAADLWYTHGKGPPGRRKIIVKEEQKQMKLDQHIFLIGFMGCGKSILRGLSVQDDRRRADRGGSGDRKTPGYGDNGDLPGSMGRSISGIWRQSS